MRIYLDQNAWQRAKNDFTALEFKQLLKTFDFKIYLGTHNIYEFGKCFLDNFNIDIGTNIFKYLYDLGIDDFLKDTNNLILSDLVYARSGGRLITTMDIYETSAMKEEITRLSKGLTDRAHKFIKNREDEMKTEWPQYQDSVRMFNIGMQPLSPKPEVFVSLLRDDWGYRRNILNQKGEYGTIAKDLSDSLLFSNPEKYPCLNAYINYQLYLNYLILSDQKASIKRTPDGRHLITANACDRFVTEDRTIYNNSEYLCPYLSIMKWSEFKNLLQE